MPRAFLRFGQMLLIAAMLSACGAQWLALQSFAWGKMLLDYTRSCAWSEAVQKTFDGEHPCNLCKSIEREKKSEKKSDVTIIVTKLNLFHQPRALLVIGEGATWKFDVCDSVREPRFERPALPPPRFA